MSKTDSQTFLSSISPRFRLRVKDKNKPAYIFMEVAFHGKRTRIFMKNCKVLPTQWNEVQQLAYISPQLSALDNHNNTVVNGYIITHKQRFSEFIAYICTSIGLVDRFHLELKNYFSMGRPKKASRERKPQEDIYKLLEKQIINTDSASSGKHRKAVNIFKTYATEYRVSQGYSPITDFHEITCAVMDDFRDYLMDYEQPNGEHYAASTANTKMKGQWG